jgi:CRP-like cAMP-binding protein
MALSPSAAPPPRNRLLAALPAEDLARLWPQLEPTDVKLRQVLHAPDEPITAVFFPEAGMVSMLTVLTDGRAAEVGVVGSEGMVGVPLLLGGDSSAVEAMCQAAGPMLRLRADLFQRALEESAALRGLLLRYTLAFQQQVSQTAACNGNHTLHQRLARWLLLAHDRAESDEFVMTQEFMALMLCVHRPSVTQTAQSLQEVGIIRYGKGRVTILDRAGLEAAACECHGAVRRQFEKLLGTPRG